MNPILMFADQIGLGCPLRNRLVREMHVRPRAWCDATLARVAGHHSVFSIGIHRNVDETHESDALFTKLMVERERLIGLRVHPNDDKVMRRVVSAVVRECC